MVVKISPGGHLMGEPSLVPPDFFPPKKRQHEPLDWEIEEFEAMEEEELLKQWEWYEYEMDSS
jgi:hypothetical protein